MEVPPTAFIMVGAAPCRAFWSGDVRKVGISSQTFVPVVTRRRTLLWISSALKSLGCIQLPASSAVTLMPARVRGSTATPAAAPSPTTTTSTGFRLVAMIFSRPIQLLPEGLGRILHALVLGANGEFRAGITDQIPAGEVLVAPVDRIAEHAFEREAAHSIEKAAQVRRLIIVDGGEYCVLFVGGQAGE